MNGFKQHIPNFVDVSKNPEWHDFETINQLLALEVVQRYGKGDKFSHFALSDNRLMEVSDNGLRWRVVGYIKDPDAVDFPQWEGWKYRAEMPDGTIKTLTDEVVSSCGGILELADGTTARDMRR